MPPIDATAVLVALIAAGLLKALIDLVKWAYARWRGAREAATPEGRASRSVQTAEESLAVVAKARDELESDNALVRATLAQERAQWAAERSDLVRRHAAERAEWQGEKTALRSEIDTLQARLRAMLDELEDLKRRHP